LACLLAAAGAALVGKLLSAGVAVSTSLAFVGGSSAALSRSYEGRTVQVARYMRQGLVGRKKKDEILGQLRQMSDEDLHNVVALGRQHYFEYRLDSFRKRKPDRKNLQEMHYKLIASKTILRERAIDVEKKAAEDAEPEEPEVYADWVARTYDYEKAKTTFAARPGIRRSRHWPVAKTRAAGKNNVIVPYYDKAGFTPPGESENATRPWEEGVRGRWYHGTRNYPGAFTKKEGFKKPKSMPGMMPR